MSGLICWLILTICWTTDAARLVEKEEGDARQQRDVRRIDPPVETGDWKPIDYGHPMRNDPTLVYVPPVVDPVHYGIQSAEPLWPIRGPKLPALKHLQPEVATSSTADRRWSRPRPSPRPKDVVTWPRMANPRQRSDHPQQQQKPIGDLSTTLRPPARVHRPIHHRPIHIRPQIHAPPVQRQSNRRFHIQQHIIQQQLIKRQPPQKPLPKYIRQPVTQTAWTDYDYSTNRPLGRSAAIGPASTPTPIRKPINVYTSPSPNRIFSGASSGRSFGSNVIDVIADQKSSSALIIDRSDDTTNVPDLTTASETPQQENIKRKRARKPLVPFVIQQGHSKVRKFGAATDDAKVNQGMT